jgi:hypothetical protein
MKEHTVWHGSTNCRSACENEAYVKEHYVWHGSTNCRSACEEEAYVKEHNVWHGSTNCSSACEDEAMWRNVMSDTVLQTVAVPVKMAKSERWKTKLCVRY